MSTPHRRGPDDGPGYETRDVAFRPIVLTAIFLVVLSLATVWLMAVLERRLVARDTARSAPPSALAESYGRSEPPAPRLQDHALRDLAALRERDRLLLETYGWVDRGAGRVRIPVEQALQLLVAEGHTR